MLGWLFARSHAFPVVRESQDRAALRFALGVLRDGHVLLVYPEGTRSWDGRLLGGTRVANREAAATMMEHVIALLPDERPPVAAGTHTLGGSPSAA